jgi:hypothetical protein
VPLIQRFSLFLTTESGYTLSLSDAAVPAILVAPEAMMVQQWRIQYLRGFMVRSLGLLLSVYLNTNCHSQIAIPATIVNILSWGTLAYLGKRLFGKKKTEQFLRETIMRTTAQN